MESSSIKEKTIEEVATGERKFLHDISNKLVVAEGMGSFLSKALESNSSISDKEKQRMQKILTSVRAMAEMVKSRRDTLISLHKELT